MLTGSYYIYDLSWAPSGRTIAASYSDEHFLPKTALIDVEIGTVRAVITSIWQPSWSRSALLFTGNVCTGFDVFTVNADGSGLRNYTQSETTDLWPHWSPDGRTITFTTYGPEAVSLASLDIGSGATRTLASGSFDELSVTGWSPDGKLLAFHFGGGKGLCEGEQQSETTTVQFTP